MGRNRQVKLDGEKASIRGVINGEEFRIYFRKYRDKRKKIVRLLSGPGLQNLTRKRPAV